MNPGVGAVSEEKNDMTWVITALMLSGVMLSTSAWAQGNSETESERPATASYWGDTGLWFLPTAEVLRPRGWSFSLYRTELDFEQGQTDVSDWPLTAAVGAGPRGSASRWRGRAAG